MFTHTHTHTPSLYGPGTRTRTLAFSPLCVPVPRGPVQCLLSVNIATEALGEADPLTLAFPPLSLAHKGGSVGWEYLTKGEGADGALPPREAS